ncbi:hypothetical protein GGS23DRAFT_463707 [Durotheca rogersii]|uniref:uncharacterized protein n=1 Tax=Durotheca rogersii TaxID=419775 RepID=UPI0022203917|nr:uncharacterized protein GGS23DRAFT_463707 [Durotheca rogersii]KAI5864791.1 hypothetical protein GGS23DRAFT_463707 [Durotheca rogersii]
MPSLRNTLAAAVALIASVRGDYDIDPSSVSLTIRTYWCQSEISTCPLICQQTTSEPTLVNDCDAQTLRYGCVCGDGKQPNVSEYSLTLPYFVCTEWGSQCVTACGQDNACSSSCRENNPCGARNPTRANQTSSSVPSATSSTAEPSDENTIFNGLDGSQQNSDTPGSGAFRLAGNEGLFGFALLGASVCLGMLML